MLATNVKQIITGFSEPDLPLFTRGKVERLNCLDFKRFAG
jgi:hypothetical protein